MTMNKTTLAAVRAVSDIESLEDLRAVYDAMKTRWGQLNNTVCAEAFQGLYVGLPVCFEFKGQLVSGTIERVNRKTVTISVPGSPGYRVPPRLVQAERS